MGEGCQATDGEPGEIQGGVAAIRPGAPEEGHPGDRGAPSHPTQLHPPADDLEGGRQQGSWRLDPMGPQCHTVSVC